MEADLQVDITGLKKLVKDLNKPRKIEVGVLDDERSAKIGFKHEFGNEYENLPMRSFLLMPIHQRQEQLEDVAQNTLDGTGDIKQVYTKVAQEAKYIIDGAFETGGYGQWAELSGMAVARKLNNKDPNAILIDTGQLRRSIKARVVNL